jgi:small conductance mechanosensitive channel
MNINLQEILQNSADLLVEAGFKLLAAIVLWIAGRWLIRMAIRLVERAMGRQSVDLTLVGYVRSGLAVLLNVTLIVAILGFFGVETTTFAALLAASGVAVGAAWGGILSNFAAGVFLVVLRPFKVGDAVTAAGVTGVVEHVGLFATTIITPDLVSTTVGNAKILADTIQNFSKGECRRVDLLVQLDHSTDPNAAIRSLKQALAAIPNVLEAPATEVGILQFSLPGPVLAVRPYTAPQNYWQVYFDTNRIIRETFRTEGYAFPQQRYTVRAAAGFESQQANAA